MLGRIEKHPKRMKKKSVANGETANAIQFYYEFMLINTLFKFIKRYTC